MPQRAKALSNLREISLMRGNS